MQNGAGVVRQNETAIAFAVLIAIALALGIAFVQTPRPHSDAIRYITYAINLYDHGVFSLSDIGSAGPPVPGSGHTPLYSAWIAIFAALDGGLRDTLVCVLKNNVSQAPCPSNFGSIVAAQLILAGVFFGCVWLLAKRLSGNNDWIAALAVLCALLAKSPLRYANEFLTEALLLPLLALFTLFLTIAYQERRPRWMLAAGGALGLAALTRPAYAYLFLVMIGVLTVLALVRRRRALLLACALFAVAYGIAVAPWMVRNKQLADRFALTTAYDGDILAQRIAYNRMTWREYGLSFLLWFPDIGDNLAKLAAPKKDFIKLTWDPGSYYEAVAPKVYEAALRDAGGPDKVVGYLLRSEVLAHPVKHALVSVPLALRAVFISKYWGIFGLICFVVLVIRRAGRNDYTFLLLSLPIWWMVAFHALVSVSIPRYNLGLIPFYAYAMAWAIHAIGCKIFAMLRQRVPVR